MAKEKPLRGATIMTFGSHTYCDSGKCPPSVEDCEECPAIDAHRRAEEIIRRLTAGR